MKNTIRIFWIIIILTVIELSFLACSGGESGDIGSNGSATVNVINNYINPITKVEIESREVCEKFEFVTNINPGTTKTFNITFANNIRGASSTIVLYANDLNHIYNKSSNIEQSSINEQVKINRYLSAGKALTIILKRNGKVE